jgi:hypothetical protein
MRNLASMKRKSLKKLKLISKCEWLGTIPNFERNKTYRWRSKFCL